MKRILSIILFFVSLQSIGQVVKNKQLEFGPVVRQGNPIGYLLEKTSLADTVGLTGGEAGSATYTISGSKLHVVQSGADYSYVRWDSLTSLDVIHGEWVVSFNSFAGDSYFAQFGLFEPGFPSGLRYSIYGSLSTRNDNGTLGRLSITSRDNAAAGTTLATSPSDLSISAITDSILIIFDKFENTIIFSARNLTTNSAWVTVPYTLTGTQTSHSVGYMGIVTGKEDYNIHQFKISSKQVKNPPLYLYGDSKFTKSTYQNESLAALLKNNYGGVYANCAVGSTSADLVANRWEVINIIQPPKVLIEVSNDIRLGVSSGTWQANLTLLYDDFTANGIDVYFTCLYETGADQSAMDTWLTSNYPDAYIRSPYVELQKYGSGILVDGIHLSAIGNKIVADALMLDGRLENTDPFNEMKFTAGETDYTAVGDSIISHRRFMSSKLNVFRDGELQWEADSYEPYSITRTDSNIIFHPPLSTGERVVIQSYNHIQWTTIIPYPIPPSPVCVVFTTSGDLTESPSCTWSSAAGTGKGYGTTSLAAGDDGYFLIKNTDGANTDLNPIGLDDDGDNTEDYTAWEYCIYRNTFINEYSYQNNGSSGSSGVAAAANDWLRLRKEGTVVYAEKSTNSGASWTLVYTFSGSAAHTLYPKTHLVVAGKKIIDASVLNFH